jgi:hypothetical protein
MIELTWEFESWAAESGLPDEGDASDLLGHPALTEDQRTWLTDFIARWNAAEDQHQD